MADSDHPLHLAHHHCMSPFVSLLSSLPPFRLPRARRVYARSHQTHQGVKPDVIVGLDARGFLFGPIIAMRLGAAFVPVRKAGKL